MPEGNQVATATPITSVPDVTPSTTPAPATDLGSRLVSLFDSASNPQPTVTVQSNVEPQAPEQGHLTTQPEVTPPQPPKQELLAGKYPSVDELVKAHRNQDSALTRAFQERAEALKAVETLKAEIEQIKSAIPQKQPEPEPLFPEGFNPKEVADLLYDKPEEGFAKWNQAIEQKLLKKLEEKFEAKVAPIAETLNKTTEKLNMAELHQKWDDATMSFEKEHPDMQQFVPAMKQFMAAFNLGNSTEPAKVIEAAYNYARGYNYQPPQQVNPDDFLKDEQFVNSKILSNPDIVNRVLQNHMASVKQVGQQVPKLIDQTVTGAAPVMPANKPRNTDEATAMLLERLNSMR